MKAYYMRLSDRFSEVMNIIDEDRMAQAEQGKNYLNPDDYDFLCEANSLEEAEHYYWNVEFQEDMKNLSERQMCEYLGI